MGFFDDISKKLTAVGQEAFNQASDLAGTARNKVKTADLERQLNNVFSELGKKYYETIKDNVPAEYAELVTRIKDLSVQVEQYRAEARRERGVTVCPKCGAEVPMGTSFCSACGATVPQPGTVATVVCPSCGTSLAAGTAFCTACGTNVQQVQPTITQMPLGQVDLSSGSISSMQAPVTQPPMTAQPMQAPVTQPPMTAQPMQAPVTQPPMTAQPMQAPVTQPPMTAQPMQAPVTQPPVTAQPVAVNFLTKQPEAPAAAPAAVPNLLTKQPEAPAAAPAAPTAGGFPQGGSSAMAMDIDTKTVYGDTGSSGSISLQKN